VKEATRRPYLAVHSGGRPCFLEFRTYRFRAHSMFDPQLHREKQEVEEWKKRDPIIGLQTRLQEQGLLSEQDLAQLEEEIVGEITDAVQFAENSSLEPIEELTRFAYSEKPRP
jgi:TPP-dependent pyruvate/acetoin dehydrogenase alpha subunit